MRPREQFDFDVYISYYNPYQFFERGKISEREPVWSEKGLVYDYTPENAKELNLTIPVNDNLVKMNRTLYLHMQVTTKNPFYRKGLNDKDYDHIGKRSSGSNGNDG